jgi:cytochrome c-type biogenesis protein CcmH/NrfF
MSAVVLSAFCLALPVYAGDESETSWAYDAAHELMSPFCPGRTLAECTSPQAGELRGWIVVQAAAGRTRDDVYEELYERYGNKVRPTPKAEGIGLTAYALPIAAFLGGGVLVVIILRRLTAEGRSPEPAVAGRAGAPAVAAAASTPEDAELQRIVDEELRG